MGLVDLKGIQGEAMINVKEAAEAAKAYLGQFGTDLPELLVEEVEKSEDDQFWLITLGYSETPLAIQFGAMDRKYKLFRIGAKDGNVVSMTMACPRPVGSFRRR